MSLIILQVSAAIIIWLISLIGGFSAIYLHRKVINPHIMYLAESFAGGIFLGAALFHMLPDAQFAFREIYPTLHYPLGNLICAAGFCLLLLLEQVTKHFSSSTQKHSQNLVPLLLLLLLSVHAISEGIALGVNQGVADMAVIFMAIAVHKTSEAFAAGLQLQKGTLALKNIITLFLLFSFMSPLGILFGSFAQHAMTGNTSLVLMGIFNAFAAGTFLYIATLHKLHHNHEGAHLGELLFTLLGLILMAVVAVWV